MVKTLLQNAGYCVKGWCVKNVSNIELKPLE